MSRDMGDGMVRAFGGAAVTDEHLLADVRAIDDGIVVYLLRRERKSDIRMRPETSAKEGLR